MVGASSNRVNSNRGGGISIVPQGTTTLPRSETGRGHSSPLQARSSEVAAPSPRSSPRNGSHLASSRLRGVQRETGGLQIRRSQPSAQSANVQQPSRASHPVEPVQVLLCPRRTPQTPRSRGRQFVARCSPVVAAALGSRRDSRSPCCLQTTCWWAGAAPRRREQHPGAK
jgi:hypothetical protein